MIDWFNTLHRSLAAAGWPPVVWEAGSARLMLTPRGARVIACELPGVEGSLFWHDPRLADPAQADALLAAGGAVAGDRLWIAPESAFMWSDLAGQRHDLGRHARTPRQMDPGDYRIVAQSPGHLRLSAEMALHDARTNQKITIRITRQFDLVHPPPPPEAPAKIPGALPGELPGVGFTVRNDLTILDADPAAAVGCWDILQLPPVGTLTCPTIEPVAGPRSYYETFGDRHVRVEPAAVSFLVDARRRVKMGLGPRQTTGRMGYYRRLGKLSTLIVRLFLPQPGLPYVDLPVDEVLQGWRTGGDALQAYNDSGDGSTFGEMEYHEPAVVAGQTSDSRGGTCLTHCLAGPDEQIRHVGRRLLGVELADLAGPDQQAGRK